MDSRLDLNKVIRPTLARMEDSLIFDLFERARYKVNGPIYIPGEIRILDESLQNISDYSGLLSGEDFKPSFLDFLLRGTEELHARAGRYLHSEEYPFFTNLPKPTVVRISEDSPIKRGNINLNSKIKKEYLQAIRDFCEPGDDGHYGSSSVCDIKCLHDLSRRIHYGTYVAESKFQAEPELYSLLISKRDISGILAQLTNTAVEESIVSRVRQKGERYGVNPEFIVAFYKDKIIPLTKEVEVEYLIRREK